LCCSGKHILTVGKEVRKHDKKIGDQAGKGTDDDDEFFFLFIVNIVISQGFYFHHFVILTFVGVNFRDLPVFSYSLLVNYSF